MLEGNELIANSLIMRKLPGRAFIIKRSRNGHRCVRFGQLSFGRVISNNVIVAFDCIMIQCMLGIAGLANIR